MLKEEGEFPGSLYDELYPYGAHRDISFYYGLPPIENDDDDNDT